MSFASSKPFQTTTQDRLLGAFILIALLAAVFLFVLRIELGYENSNIQHYYTELSDSHGIGVGASITLSGVTIGNIDKIELNPNGKVKVRLALQNNFKNFYKKNSRLQIKSDIGIETVLSGAGMLFISGDAATSLQPGDYIQSIEPESLNDMLERWKIDDIAQQIADIVKHVDSMMSAMAENQQYFINTLDNSAKLSASLIKTADKLPTSLEKLDNIAEKISGLLNNVSDDYQVSQQQLNALLSNLNQFTTQMSDLTVQLEPALNQTPALIGNLNSNSQQINHLLIKLNNHWLLGDNPVTTKKIQVKLPADSQIMDK
jgi:phospholipid/cholesterol/gamma-HCH transport system substrate-binding protein